jgi:hypothetical protein
MMAFATVPAGPGLAQLTVWPVVGTHDMREFMETCLLALADAASVIRADLDSTLGRVGATDSFTADHRYGVSV